MCLCCSRIWWVHAEITKFNYFFHSFSVFILFLKYIYKEFAINLHAFAICYNFFFVKKRRQKINWIFLDDEVWEVLHFHRNIYKYIYMCVWGLGGRGRGVFVVYHKYILFICCINKFNLLMCENSLWEIYSCLLKSAPSPRSAPIFFFMFKYYSKMSHHSMISF